MRAVACAGNAGSAGSAGDLLTGVAEGDILRRHCRLSLQRVVNPDTKIKDRYRVEWLFSKFRHVELKLRSDPRHPRVSIKKQP